MRTKKKLYGIKQIEIHIKLKGKLAKKRTKQESKRLKELDGLANRRKYAAPGKIKGRLAVGVPLASALPRGYGAILPDLAVNGWAATRATLACAWLVKQWDLAVFVPLEPIKERVPDLQRATTQTTLVYRPPHPDAVAVEGLKKVTVDNELLDIFNKHTGSYKVQVSFKWLLYNEASGEYTWFSIYSLTSNPQEVALFINNTISNFQNQGENANSEYGKYLIKLSAYVQMKTLDAYNKMVRNRITTNKPKSGIRTPVDPKIKTKGSKNK
jgi:hypothetical protein